ncbi:hypothetical protein HYX16_00785 [Candidatus Woesearchaeota archaeon]|nr:hypothetical protein [Candidatus Woesearchaeota archaeon]
MKKVFLYILVLTLIINSAYAFVNIVSDYPLEDPQSSLVLLSQREGLSNKAPVTTLNYPGDGFKQVVNGNLVEFSWSYSDPENDEQKNYQLEIDSNIKFLTPLTYYGFMETKRKVYITEGNKDYYWRARSNDGFGWGDFSQTSAFYVDLTKKICSDGTPYYQCSNTDLKYCDQGILINDCTLCGCPANSECTPSGLCRENTCSDDTAFGSCSARKPNFCQNGNLVEVCSLCGCPADQVCNNDGLCAAKVSVDFVSGGKLNPLKYSPAQRFFNFLKALFFKQAL